MQLIPTTLPYEANPKLKWLCVQLKMSPEKMGHFDAGDPDHDSDRLSNRRISIAPGTPKTLRLTQLTTGSGIRILVPAHENIETGKHIKHIRHQCRQLHDELVIGQRAETASTRVSS